MIETRLGNRYATSIFELAKERGQLDQVREDLELIRGVCDQNPDFILMLKSPLIYADKKQHIIDMVFGGKLSEITRQLIEIIVRKKREPYLYDISVCFLKLLDTENNITRGVIKSAVPVPVVQKEKIRELANQKLNTEIVLEEVVDPELVGGFILKVGGFLYDGSISSAIRRLKQEFEKNPYIKKV